MSARLRGLDISACQGHVDFDALPSWVTFVVVKVAEGETGRDPMRDRNLAEARRKKLHTFLYVFLRT
jgi:GH25 family lysozyme M1 (1,4-beta-N-acetylmuramidase)